MPGAYHSAMNEKGVRQLCGFPLLGFKTQYKGNAPPCPNDQEDVIDEGIKYFKANVLFKNFEVHNACDKLLIYVTLYISQCLSKLPHKSKGEAEKLLYSLSIENFTLPGDKTFALGGLVSAPPSRADSDFIRIYMTQLRQEVGTRLIAKVYAHGNMEPDKWWIIFTKKKFLNKTL